MYITFDFSVLWGRTISRKISRTWIPGRPGIRCVCFVRSCCCCGRRALFVVEIKTQPLSRIANKKHAQHARTHKRLHNRFVIVLFALAFCCCCCCWCELSCLHRSEIIRCSQSSSSQPAKLRYVYNDEDAWAGCVFFLVIDAVGWNVEMLKTPPRPQFLMPADPCSAICASLIWRGVCDVEVYSLLTGGDAGAFNTAWVPVTMAPVRVRAKCASVGVHVGFRWRMYMWTCWRLSQNCAGLGVRRLRSWQRRGQNVGGRTAQCTCCLDPAGRTGRIARTHGSRRRYGRLGTPRTRTHNKQNPSPASFGAVQNWKLLHARTWRDSRSAMFMYAIL